MSSKKNTADPFAGLDFERDMPLTSEDIKALARSREMARRISTEAYLDWLTLMWRKDQAPEPFVFDEPFTL